MVESGKVFLAWGDPRSKAIAEALHEWLPLVINAIKPWVSSRNIGPGSRWNPSLALQLEGARMGILCLTPEALDSQWLIFEAGALSKTLGSDTLVCPYLFNLEISAISSNSPLAQFQAVRANAEETKRLLESINRALGESAIPAGQLEKAFDKWWPDLEDKFGEISHRQYEQVQSAPSIGEREILEEILQRVRELATRIVPSAEMWRAALEEVSGNARERRRLNKLLTPDLIKSIEQIKEYFESSPSMWPDYSPSPGSEPPDEDDQ
jgi:hypothetical protein